MADETDPRRQPPAGSPGGAGGRDTARPDGPADAPADASSEPRQRRSLDDRVAATRARARPGDQAPTKPARPPRRAAAGAEAPPGAGTAGTAVAARSSAAERNLATGTARTPVGDGPVGPPDPPPGQPRLDDPGAATTDAAAIADGARHRAGLPAVIADRGASGAFSLLPKLGAAMGAVRGASLPEFRLPRVRLIPVLIFVCVLMLGVRVGDLATGGAGSDTILTLGPGLPLQAQEPAAEDDAAAADEETAAQTAQVGDLPDDPDPAVPEGALAPTPDEDDDTPRAALDPTRLSPGELRMLEDLADRRERLETRERQLDQREAMIEVAEQRVEEKITELDALRGEIEALLVTVDEQREAQLASLVRIYEAMRPAEAATIFNGLELEVLIGVLGRMDEDRSAPILGAMDPARAREVTAQLADRVDAAAAMP